MNKERTIIALALAILAGALALNGFVRAAGSPAIDWQVVGSGGGSAQSGNITLSGTIGQAAVGSGNLNNVDLCSGFWGCSGISGHTAIYLPVVMK